MKRFLLLTCMFSLWLNAIAQITITNSNMPASSDTIRYSTALATGVDYNLTGAGITWDFTSLTALGQDIYRYKPSAQINLAYSLFFGLGSYGLLTRDSLNLGVATLTDMYDFYKNTSSNFKTVGRGVEYLGLPVPSDFSDDDEIYQFPLDYNDYDSSTFAVSFNLSGTLELFQKGYRINDVEGWGTMNTPFGSFNCLKVVSTVYEKDSLVVSGFPLPAINQVTRQIKWVTTTEKIPVVEVQGTVLLGNFVPTTLRYRDAYNACLAETPNLAFTASQTIGTVNDIFVFTNTTTCATVYTWSVTPNNATFVNTTNMFSQNPEIQFTDTGYYTIKLTAFNSAGQDSLVQTAYIHIIGPDGVSNASTSDVFQIYPNPSNGLLEIQSSSESIFNLTMRDVTGRIIYSEKNTPQRLSKRNFDFNALQSGMYFLEVQTENGIRSQKWVKK